MTQRVLILGIGNVLMLDEGVGPRLAEELQRSYVFTDDVEVVDAGTMGLGMMPLFRNLDYMLVVDAIDGTGHPPGTVVRLAPEDFAQNQILHSLHDMKFVDVLNACTLVGIEVEAECIGIQIESISPVELTIGLSERVEAALPRATAAVLTLLAERGIEPAECPPVDDEHAAFLAQVRGALSEMRTVAGDGD